MLPPSSCRVGCGMAGAVDERPVGQATCSFHGRIAAAERCAVQVVLLAANAHSPWAVGPAAFLIWTLGGLLRRVERPAANDRVHVLTSLLSSRIEAGERRSAILAETEACVKRRKLVRWGSC